jgi:cytochrome c oxidase assembly protein subunit 11
MAGEVGQGRTMAGTRRRNGILAVVLVSVVGGMVGLSFAAVPLYRLFCQVTGYAGTPNTDVQAGPAALGEGRITVRLDANVNSALPWRIRPETPRLSVQLGETALAHYLARNLSSSPVIGQATFSVTPYKAAQYFAKIECFCFTEQRLAPGEEVPMAVSFYVDPQILDDPDARDVQTITLSYTFFPAAEDGERKTAWRRNDG